MMKQSNGLKLYYFKVFLIFISYDKMIEFYPNDSFGLE